MCAMAGESKAKCEEVGDMSLRETIYLWSRSQFGISRGETRYVVYPLTCHNFDNDLLSSCKQFCDHHLRQPLRSSTSRISEWQFPAVPVFALSTRLPK